MGKQCLLDESRFIFSVMEKFKYMDRVKVFTEGSPSLKSGQMPIYEVNYTYFIKVLHIEHLSFI